MDKEISPKANRGSTPKIAAEKQSTKVIAEAEHARKINRKLLTIIFLLLLIVLSGGAYLLSQNNKVAEVAIAPTMIPSPTSDPTANWKTYENTKNNWTVKYPTAWFISSPYGSPKPSSESDDVYFSTKISENPTTPAKGRNGTVSFYVGPASAKELGKTPKEIFDDQITNDNSLKSTILNTRTRSLDGVEAYEAEYSNSPVFEKQYYRSVILVKNSLEYIIQYHEVNVDDKESTTDIAPENWQYDSLFENMLSTFKFTK